LLMMLGTLVGITLRRDFLSLGYARVERIIAF